MMFDILERLDDISHIWNITYWWYYNLQF